MTQEETISKILQQLCEVAENNEEKNNIDNALGEVIVNGVVYQIQISLIADKKLWINENDVRFSSVVKIHN